jgi:hypothetical protein
VRCKLISLGFELEGAALCASGPLKLPAQLGPGAGSATEASCPAGKDSASFGATLRGDNQGDARSEHGTDYHSETQQTH